MIFIMILIISITSYTLADVNTETRNLDKMIREPYTHRLQAILE